MVTLLKELIQKSFQAYKRQKAWNTMAEKGLARVTFRTDKRQMRTKEGELK